MRGNNNIAITMPISTVNKPITAAAFLLRKSEM
jgi:hypothetical protein